VLLLEIAETPEDDALIDGLSLQRDDWSIITPECLRVAPISSERMAVPRSTGSGEAR